MEGGLGIRLTDPKTNREYHFTPSRDIAYYWPDIIDRVYRDLQEPNWAPWYGDYLRHSGVTEKDLMETLAAYYAFCRLSADPDQKDLGACLDYAGFTSKPKPAQLVVLAKLGQVSSGAFWTGIRSANGLAERPADFPSLDKACQELDKYIKAKWHECPESAES